jgi:glycosyltransferase involved in cell wall biosynthesis
MRILSITAGAAGMYCGSCFRDNAMAAQLLARGHDVTLLPVYTPTRTDERNVSQARVLFGGISVYLQQHSAFFRNTPRFLDRLWDSPRVISAFANRAVSTDARLLGDLTISMLQGDRGVLRKEFDKLIEWTADEPVPDVINLPNSMLIGMARPLARALKRPVCCTLQGEELFLTSLVEPYRTKAIALIREQVADVDHFIAVSDYCARFMSGFLNIPSSRISVVPLGISTDGHGRGASTGRPFTVGYFARVAPEKGLHLLADAYSRLRSRTGGKPMRLLAAGYLAAEHQAYLTDVRRTLERANLGAEFIYRGVLDRPGKLSFFQELDVLSVPAVYDEPKGLFLLESMASGVPAVQPRRGGFTEVLERTGGGLLVAPDDAEALAVGLTRLADDRALREQLAERAYAGIRTHYTIAQSADRLIEVYGMVTGSARGGRGATGR